MDYIRAEDLRNEWGFSNVFIRKEIAKGNLTGEKRGKLWFVLKDEKYQAWLANPRRNSRSSKNKAE